MTEVNLVIYPVVSMSNNSLVLQSGHGRAVASSSTAPEKTAVLEIDWRLRRLFMKSRDFEVSRDM